MLDWMSRDGRILVAARVVRSGIQGFFGVGLAVYLTVLGYGAILVGFALTAALLTSAGFTWAATLMERRWGRRRVLIGFAALSTVALSGFVATTNYYAMLVAICTSTVGLGGGGGGPFQSVEQAVVAQAAAPERRTMAYATYNAGGWLAMSAGALLVDVPALLHTQGLGLVDGFKVVFSAVVIGMLAVIALYRMLSTGVETPPETTVQGQAKRGRSMLSPDSRRKIGRLSALIGLDAFGGGFVAQSIAALWFYARFGASLGSLSLVFFASNLASTVCFLVAARLAARIGLVNTMVFTHLPSNILTVLIPFAPTLTVASAMFTVRGFLNPMDIAPRQSYIAAIVKPEERVAAAASTNVARSISQAVSPSISGYLLQFVSLSDPFFLGGGLKAAYDLALYKGFRALKAPEEEDGRAG